MKVKFETLGCKLNIEETHVLMEEAATLGMQVVEEDPEVVIINSCTVTHVTDKKVRQLVRKYHRKDVYTVLTGCYAQIEQDTELPVDLLIPNDQKQDTIEILARELSFYAKESSSYHYDKTRSFLQIQNGCNEFCSYCIIPYARGRSRSFKLSQILDQALHMKELGAKEIVLTGIHISSYGKERNEGLIDLLEILDKNLSGVRIRLGSLEPNIITDEFLKRLKKLSSICPQFHLSLQSGSNEVLKAMNRKYTKESYLKKVQMIREFYPMAAITTDIIVGYPTEKSKDFQQSVDFVREVEFSAIHVFPYSKREGTRAAKLMDLSPKTKKQRVEELIEVGDKYESQYIKSFLGKTVEVLFEKNQGITREHVSVELLEGVLRNDLISAEVVGIKNNQLILDPKTVVRVE